MSLVSEPSGERRRKLRVDQEPQSSHAKDDVIALVRRVFEGGRDILRFQHRVILKDFLMARSGSQQIEDGPHPDTQTPEARAAAALLWIDGDAVSLGHVCFSLSRVSPALNPTPARWRPRR